MKVLSAKSHIEIIEIGKLVEEWGGGVNVAKNEAFRIKTAVFVNIKASQHRCV